MSLAKEKTPRPGSAQSSDAPRIAEPEPAEAASFPIVGVGASAGGMEAFVELLRFVPQDADMAFVLIQHLDPTHASYLSEALAHATSFPVHEIQDGMHVQPGHVYVIPSNADVGILKGTLALLPRPTQERRPHLPIDFFFKALASDRGNQAIGVVLSGTGSDGSVGLRAIKATEGVTFAQEPTSAKFGGMPDAAIKTGAVDFALPIPALAQELSRIGRHPYLRSRELEVLTTPADETDLRKVLVLLRREAGIDFSEYKLTSIRRRVARRMAVRRLETLQEYVQLLRDDTAEVKSLFDDILIHVTSFFRDGATFEKLSEHVFPEILKHKRDGGTIRIWCAGCSTGEEAYSLVIALLMFLERENASDVPVQLFGTDIGGMAIEKARAGFYREAAIRDVGPERLARFFTKQDGGYAISRTVRERCAFVKHDLASDPPFSKLDLVSCRNVLIYLGPELQKRVLATFHFALNEPGFLLLGHAESIMEGTNLFRVVDKESKIFARTAVKSALHLAPARDLAPMPPRPPALPARAAPTVDIVRRTESLLLDRYAPPGVIINERMEILHFCGHTGPYLEPAPGQPQVDLIKMAKKGLVADLRIAFSQARKEKTTTRRAGVRFEQNGAARVCDVVVIPVATPPESIETAFLVLFEEHKPSEPPVSTETVVGTGRPPSELDVAEDHDAAALRTELDATKDYLHSLIEEHRQAGEELQATNEELISSNEELQSLNEELQTAKEELQSTNEELSTLNEELRTRNTDLNTVNSDLMNILGSVEVPIVIVDGGRNIRRFTPKARPILNLLPSDVGRPIDDIKPSLNIENLDQKIAEVIDTITQYEEEVQDKAGRWFRLQVRPYMTVERRIDGAVISIVDIDVLKRALGAAEWARDYAKATVEAIQTPLVLVNDRSAIVSTNRAFDDCYGLSRAEAEGRSIFEVLGGAFSNPVFRSTFEKGLLHEGSLERVDVQFEIPHRGTRSVALSGASVLTPSRERLLLFAVDDVTERRGAEMERDHLLHETETARASAEEANRTKDAFLATLSHELRTPLSTVLYQAQFLRQGKLDEEKVRKGCGVIERAVKAQAQLIDDLLDVSRISTGKLAMDLRAVDLASVVQDVVEMVSPTAEKKKLEVEVHVDEGLPPVSGDATRLQQVVSNLLTNAIKFTERGRIVVTLDSEEDRARIRVSDTGIGIDRGFLPRLFTRFSQEIGGRTRTHGGLGLGLAIVRYVVEAHGGSVEAESAGRGKGATFTVLLPMMTSKPAPAPEGELHAGDLAAGSLKDIRILVVEDDEGTCQALTDMLGLTGAEVRAAESAARAMEVFDEFTPELLLCDIAMPDEDGYSLLHRIRARGAGRGGDVTAVALTALAGDEDRRRAVEAGFQLHLAKPVDAIRLVTSLAKLLRRVPDVA